jgi:hypothetical protein
MKLPITTIFAFGVLTTAGLAARADVDYPGFPSSTGLTLIGNATVSGGVLRLTSSNPNRVGAAWSSVQQAVGAGFSTTFTFRITSPSGGGADGLALVIRTGPPARSVATAAARYDPIPTASRSGTRRAGAWRDQNDPDATTSAPRPVSQQRDRGRIDRSVIGHPEPVGRRHTTVRIDYTPGEMDVYIDDLTQPVVVAGGPAGDAGINGGRAWVGFTAATGSIRRATRSCRGV